MNNNLPYRVVDCKFWNIGKCSKGDDCTFKHSGSTEVKVSSTNNLPYRVVDCKFWNIGKCSKGDDCTFKHSGDPVQKNNKSKSTNTLPYKTVVCTFQMHGKCLKGDKCTFKHYPLLNNIPKIPKIPESLAIKILRRESVITTEIDSILNEIIDSI